MHLNSNMSACEQAPVSQFGSSAHGSLLRAKSQFEEVNTLDIEKTESYYNQIRSGDLCDCCRNYITWIWLNFVVTSLYRHSSHNREFHNVNCRFWGAIHDVDRACISVLSQVIHNVNERKTVQTNMISFVSHGDKTLQRLVGMPGEQEHHISSVPFFFS